MKQQNVDWQQENLPDTLPLYRADKRVVAECPDALRFNAIATTLESGVPQHLRVEAIAHYNEKGCDYVQ